MSRVVNIPTSRIRNFIDFNQDPLSFFMDMLYQGDVVSLRTSLKPSYIVNSPDFIKEILVTQESKFKKGRTSKVLRRTIGEGLLTAEKDNHERQRKYHQPVFYKERLQEYANTIVYETEKVSSLLQNKTSCLLHEEMMQLTLSIIARTMFATDVEETKKELADAVNDTIEQTARTLFSPIILPITVPTKGNKIHKTAIHTLETMVNEIIQKGKTNPDLFHMTLLGLLLDTTDDNEEKISDREIRDQMITMLLAGHETTANLLTWIFYLLGKNPDVEEKFHKEVDSLTTLNEAPIDAYRNLPYTQLIIKESLRLYPPAWLIYREADSNVNLLGEKFKEGSTFMISPYSIHRNKKVFEEPERFNPERFTENIGIELPSFSYFPFGGGSRSCIGSRFALMETALVLAVLGKRFSFLINKDTQALPEPLVSLRIKGGLPVQVIPRQ